jgi:hypothetical protein
MRASAFSMQTLHVLLLSGLVSTDATRSFGAEGKPIVRLPSDFTGFWEYSLTGLPAEATEQNHGDQCQKEDNDALMHVTGRNIYPYEGSCRITAIKLLESRDDSKSVELNLTCGGEGFTHNAKEIWNVQTIGQHRSLTIVQLQTSAARVDLKYKAFSCVSANSHGQRCIPPRLHNEIAITMFRDCK